MYIVCTKQNPPLPIVLKIRKGNAVLVFKTIDDGNYYLGFRNGQYCDLKFLPEAIRETPSAFSSISQMLFLNTREAVDMILNDAENFPYEEFTAPFPK